MKDEFPFLNHIPRFLNAGNIDQAIAEYKDTLQELPLNIGAKNILTLLHQIKRKKLDVGPYRGVSLFEASNRIMTDLVILYGVKKLLSGNVDLPFFSEYKVEYGNENNNTHDLVAVNQEYNLIGEAFNVADSFFQAKKYKALKKLRQSSASKKIILLMYNQDAVRPTYEPKCQMNEFHLSVNLDL